MTEKQIAKLADLITNAAVAYFQKAGLKQDMEPGDIAKGFGIAALAMVAGYQDWMKERGEEVEENVLFPAVINGFITGFGGKVEDMYVMDREETKH